MTPRVLGIDISDASTNLVYYTEEESYRFPTVICRQKNGEAWFVGEEAYGNALSGNGVVTDKLLSLTGRQGTATLGGIKYEGRELLKLFLEHTIRISVEKSGGGFADRIVVSIPKVEKQLVDALTLCLTELGYLKSRIHIISRSESFIYFVMSQGKEVWNNQVGMFDLSDISLSYYELSMHRNAKNTTVFAEAENLDERFDLGILYSHPGMKLADKILTSCAERLLQKKIFSSIILTGNGFENTEWATDFIKLACMRRKVFVYMDVFARGACYRGVDLSGEKPIFQFTCICDGRLSATVSVKVEEKEKEYLLPLAKVGDSWHSQSTEIRLMPNNVQELELVVTPLDVKRKRVLRVPIDFLRDCLPRSTRIDVITEFKDEKTMILDIRDAGFGELNESTGARLVQEVNLWD